MITLQQWIIDSIYQTSDSFEKNKKKYDADWLHITLLDKLMKDGRELSGNTVQIQMCINSLKTSKCTLEENLPSRSHRSQALISQAKVLISSFADYSELHCNYRLQITVKI